MALIKVYIYIYIMNHYEIIYAAKIIETFMTSTVSYT